MKEKETTLLGKFGYGLKYTLAIAIAILATCALCFIFINITTYFAPPLQPMFDQERLGQLGDFLGGTLNPIFGFATVCLLLWSVFIQRKELSLTRKELKKTVKAQRKQTKINQIEFERRQLENAANSCLIELDRLFHKKIFIDVEKAASINLTKLATPNTSWNDLLYDSEIAGSKSISDFIPASTIALEIAQIKRILLLLKINVFELTKDGRYINIDSIREYWLHKVRDLIDSCLTLNIIPDDEIFIYKDGISIKED